MNPTEIVLFCANLVLIIGCFGFYYLWKEASRDVQALIKERKFTVTIFVPTDHSNFRIQDTSNVVVDPALPPGHWAVAVDGKRILTTYNEVKT